jgi:hypothetical protein
VRKIFSGFTFSSSTAARMRATSPPGSTIAARPVASATRIEQFCANRVTGRMATLSAGMVLSRLGASC